MSRTVPHIWPLMLSKAVVHAMQEHACACFVLQPWMLSMARLCHTSVPCGSDQGVAAVAAAYAVFSNMQPNS